MTGLSKDAQLSLFDAPDPVNWGELGPPERGLMIRDPYITDIIVGKKIWELRGFKTKVRGRIGLIKSRSGKVFGEAKIERVIGPLSLQDLILSWEIGPHDTDELDGADAPPYVDQTGQSKTFAWCLTDVKSYQPPIPYSHPSGAVTFVDLTQLRGL